MNLVSSSSSSSWSSSSYIIIIYSVSSSCLDSSLSFNSTSKSSSIFTRVKKCVLTPSIV
jgi:hypothetical protein